MKWPAPTATTKGSLQYYPRARGVPEVPRFANFRIQRKIRLFVGGVADRDVGDECGEEQEYVDREDGPRVQKRSSYTYQRGKQKERRAERKQDESGSICNEQNGSLGVSWRLR